MELGQCREGMLLTLLNKPHPAYVFDVGCAVKIDRVAFTHIIVKGVSGCKADYIDKSIIVRMLEDWAILENKE